jgi:hypothetical protein
LVARLDLAYNRGVLIRSRCAPNARAGADSAGEVPIMAASTEPPVLVARNDSHQRFVVYNVGWQGHEAMLQLVGDRPIRLAYDRGNLELITPSKKHETNKGLPGRLVETLTEELEPLNEVTRLLMPGATMNHTRWGRMVRTWVRDELAPRDR